MGRWASRDSWAHCFISVVLARETNKNGFKPRFFRRLTDRVNGRINLRAERYRIVSLKLGRTSPKSGSAALVICICVGVPASVLCVVRSARDVYTTSFPLTEVTIIFHTLRRTSLRSAERTRATVRGISWSINYCKFHIRLITYIPWFPSILAAQAEKQPSIFPAGVTGPFKG